MAVEKTLRLESTKRFPLFHRHDANDAKRVLDDALAKARSQDKRGHEAAILILVASVAERMGDKNQAIADLENAGKFATSVQFYRMEADAMFELARLYRDTGDLETAEVRATQGLVASQRVGDRYYLPRNLTILADLKARRGRVAEAKALYKQAEDVIEGMLISVDEPYWNSSVVAAMSQTYLQHFELVAHGGNVSEAFHVLERVRGRTLAWALVDRKAFTSSEGDQTATLETDVSVLQTRLMETSNPSEREQLLDQLVEYERRLGLARTKGDAANQRLPVQPSQLVAVEHDLNHDEVLLEYVLYERNSRFLHLPGRSGGGRHRSHRRDAVVLGAAGRVRHRVPGGASGQDPWGRDPQTKA
jgi:tetratricopeptide (TPR) repeat protein